MIKISEINLKPSIIDTLYDIELHLRKCGLTEDDIILLIQKRVKNRPSKKLIRDVLEGIKTLEKSLIKQKKLYNKMWKNWSVNIIKYVKYMIKMDMIVIMNDIL